MNGLRRINLEQAINVRDLGGYPTPDGCTPYGRFIRADNMVASPRRTWRPSIRPVWRTVIDCGPRPNGTGQPGSFENIGGRSGVAPVPCWANPWTASPASCAVWGKITPK